MSIGGSGPRTEVDSDAPVPVVSSRGSRMLGRRGVLISTASTIAFFGALVLIVALSPGAQLVGQRFFSVNDLVQSLQGSPTSPSVFGAFWLNVRIFLVAEAVILVFALIIAVVRSIPGPVFFPLRMVAIGYVDFFRGVPLLLLIYMIGFGVPGLGLRFFSNQTPVVYGTVALILVYSAYVAEVYRAGIDSVHESQVAAARSLGLTRWQSLRFVVLPQAVRRVIPPLLNDFIGLQKDTALVSVLGPIEAARAAFIYSAENFNYAPYIVASLLFVLVTIPLARFTDRLIARDRARRAATGGVR
ncbi:MAG: amino acid ABC transporter permease [Actinomycetota bacterium]